MKSPLHHVIAAPRALSAARRREMFALMAKCYDCVSRNRFEHDLLAKDCVILLFDEGETLRGFSTQQFFDWRLRGEPVRILFSGDTLIEPAYWGTATLVRAWCQVAAAELARQPKTPLFWFLISKGYRTWLYLPLFFRRFIPAPDIREPAEWRPLLQEIAEHQFGDAYEPDTGLIRFPDSQGQLAPELAGIPPGRSTDPMVRFFLERNPDYARGVELACLTQVCLDNTRGPGRRMLLEALATAGVPSET